MRQADALFRPTKQEAKADRVDRAAREIIAAETAARHQKTEKLKVARLAKAAEDTPAPAAPRKTAKKKAKAK